MRQLLQVAGRDYNPVLSEIDKLELKAMGRERPYYKPVELTPAQEQLLQTADSQAVFEQLVKDGVIPLGETQNFLIIEETTKS